MKLETTRGSLGLELAEAYETIAELQARLDASQTALALVLERLNAALSAENSKHIHRNETDSQGGDND